LTGTSLMRALEVVVVRKGFQHLIGVDQRGRRPRWPAIRA
jgi:hypothetical protein